MRIGVLGAGSWGTALAIHLSRAGHEIRLWARRQELAEELAATKVNEGYLPGAALPRELAVTSSMTELNACPVVLVVVPSHGFRQVLTSFLGQWPGGQPLTVVSATTVPCSVTTSQPPSPRGLSSTTRLRRTISAPCSLAALA